MKTRLLLVLFCAFLVSCSDVHETLLPQNLEEMESIKPAMEKLSPEERELATGYIVRHTLAAKLQGAFSGVDGTGIPEGMTLGAAIENQRSFIAERKAEEQRQAKLKAELQARREAAIKPLMAAVTVTLVSKELVSEHGYGGMLMDELLVVTFGYKNNTPKDISGVKGYVSIQDLFGDEISGFAISNDTTIPSGQSIAWQGSRSVKYAFGDNDDRKLAGLEDSKYKVIWKPQVVVFTDGSKLELPAEEG